MTKVAVGHIEIDDKGVARIEGSRSTVADIVVDHVVNGMSLEQIRQEYPHLSMAQIHAALSYYFDHRAEVDADLERRDKIKD